MSAPWTYIYECPLCDAAIQEGEDVTKNAEGETVHTDCYFNGEPIE
jgi:hypothetical protein